MFSLHLWTQKTSDQEDCLCLLYSLFLTGLYCSVCCRSNRKTFPIYCMVYDTAPSTTLTRRSIKCLWGDYPPAWVMRSHRFEIIYTCSTVEVWVKMYVAKQFSTYSVVREGLRPEEISTMQTKKYIQIGKLGSAFLIMPPASPLSSPMHCRRDNSTDDTINSHRSRSGNLSIKLPPITWREYL